MVREIYPQSQYKSFDTNVICLIKWSEKAMEADY